MADLRLIPQPDRLRAQTHMARAAEYIGAAHDLLGRGDWRAAQARLTDARLALANAADLVSGVVDGPRE